jgi:hypothetical protein
MYTKTGGTEFDWDQKVTHNLRRKGPGTPYEVMKGHAEVVVVNEGPGSSPGKKSVTFEHPDGGRKTVDVDVDVLVNNGKATMPNRYLYEWRGGFDDGVHRLVPSNSVDGQVPVRVAKSPAEALRWLPEGPIRRQAIVDLLETCRAADKGDVIKNAEKEFGVHITNVRKLLRDQKPPLNLDEFTGPKK